MNLFHVEEAYGDISQVVKIEAGSLMSRGFIVNC